MLALGALAGLGIQELLVLLIAVFGYILPFYLKLTPPASGKRTA
ncbi:MAG: hypothetical protein U5R06_05865 [candidate division KSB1 bacterium]|nr:hypothetical protein [candidate division KSB1 bacterium]